LASRKSNEERLLEIDKRIGQLTAQQKKIAKLTKDRERKARTRRLIEKGALAEKYFKAADTSPEDFEELLQRLVAVKQVESIIRSTDTKKEGVTE